MALIKTQDFIESIADALQYISYYHPEDYIRALAAAYEREESVAAKDAIAQILTNSRMCAEGKRPLCQDTGIVVAFIKVGMHARFEGDMTLEAMVNEGVRRAYLHPDNTLRASIDENRGDFRADVYFAHCRRSGLSGQGFRRRGPGN